MFGRMLKRMLFWTLLLALVWAGGLLWFVLQIPKAPQKEVPHADAIIVLTGGKDRLSNGLQLLWSKHADRLFISGVKPGIKLTDLYKTLGPIHIPDTGHIELGYQASSTMGNAVEIQEWIDRQNNPDEAALNPPAPVKTVLLVTANYHMPRSIVELKNTIRGVDFIPAPAFPEDFQLANWWGHDDTRALVLSEYHKYVLATFRHLLISWSR